MVRVGLMDLKDIWGEECSRQSEELASRPRETCWTIQKNREEAMGVDRGKEEEIVGDEVGANGVNQVEPCRLL